jgi:hypothetical protein
MPFSLTIAAGDTIKYTDIVSGSVSEVVSSVTDNGVTGQLHTYTVVTPTNTLTCSPTNTAQLAKYQSTRAEWIYVG